MSAFLRVYNIVGINVRCIPLSIHQAHPTKRKQMQTNIIGMMIGAVVLPQLVAWSLNVYAFLFSWTNGSLGSSKRTPSILLNATVANLLVVGTALALALRSAAQSQSAPTMVLFTSGYAGKLMISLMWPLLLMSKAMGHGIVCVVECFSMCP